MMFFFICQNQTTAKNILMSYFDICELILQLANQDKKYSLQLQGLQNSKAATVPVTECKTGPGYQNNCSIS